MSKPLPLTVILTLFVYSSWSQVRNVQRDNFIWLTYAVNKPLNNQIKLTVSVQSRRYAFPDRQHQLKPLVEVSKSWESGITFGVGFSYFLQALPIDRNDVAIVRPEIRPYQYLTVTHRFAKSTIAQRLMVEERWIRNTENGALVSGNMYSFRLRYRVMFQHPLDEANKWKAVVSNEFMANAGSSITTNVFDQNRLYFGAKRYMSEKINVDIGYMYWYQQFPTITDFASFHIIFLSATHTLN